MIGNSGRWKPTLAVVALLSSVVIACAWETTGADGAESAHSTSMRGAERHVQLLTLIKYLGEAPDFSGDKPFKALGATMHVQAICAEGHENKALSLCDRGALGLLFHTRSLL